MKTSISVLLILKDYIKDIYPNLTTWTSSNNGKDVGQPYIHDDFRTNTSFLMITLRPNLNSRDDLDCEESLKTSLPKTFDKDLVATSIHRLPWIGRAFQLVFSPMAIVTQPNSCKSLISISLVSHLGHLITREFVKFSVPCDPKQRLEDVGVSNATMTHSDLLRKLSKFSQDGLTICPGIVHKTHKSLNLDTIYIEPTPGDHVVRSRRCRFVLEFSLPTSKKAPKRCSECTNLDSSLTKTVEETEEIIEEDTHVETESIESEEIEESGETSPHVSNLVCLNCAAVFRYKSSFDKHCVNCKGDSKSRAKGFLCRNCGDTFHSVSSMLEHRENCSEKKATITLIRNSGQKTARKTYSSKVTRKSSEKDKDQSTARSREREETCFVCLRSYHSKSRFQDHLRVHERDIPELMQQTQCPVETCSRVFESRPDLNKHFMNDHAADDFSNKILCLKCLAPVLRDKIRRHFRSSHPSRTYKCEDCGRECLFPSMLKTHRKEMHDPNKVKPYICHLCGNVYSRVTGLSQHMLNQHSEQRQFQCKFCRKGFTSGQRLHQHERIHTGEKPFKCSLCGYRSTRKDNVQFHLRKVHKINTESLAELIEIVST